MIHFLTTWIWFLESVSSSVFHVSLTGSLLLRTFFFLSFLRFPPSPHLPPQQRLTKAESESTDARCPTPRAESESTHLTCPTLRVQVAREQSPPGTPWQGFQSEDGEWHDKKLGHGANPVQITAGSQEGHKFGTSCWPKMSSRCPGLNVDIIHSYVQGLKPTVQTKCFILKLATLESHESLMTSNLRMMKIPAQLFQVLPQLALTPSHPPKDLVRWK